MSDLKPPVAPAAVINALRPQVAVYSSPDVDELARANNLSNLAHLLKPWENSVERVTLRTSGFVSHVVPVFPLLIDDNRDLVHTELDALFLDNLSTSIEKRIPKWLENMETLSVGEGADEELWKEGTIDELTPWYAFYRSALLDRRPRTEYETFGHPVACIIAVSTSNSEPLNAFASLYEATSPDILFKDKPWIDPNVLRYYLLVHDLSTGPAEEWSTLLEDIRRSYGLHCGFLALNTEAANVPDSAYASAAHRPPPKASTFGDHWRSLPNSPTLQQNYSWNALTPHTSDKITSLSEVGGNMNDEDVKRIKAFIREFTVQSLVPWMERNVSQWNESLAANRRGIAGRLFSAGRKYFGSRPASPSNNGNIPTYDSTRGVYPHQTPEAQTRRLADFAFMICDYKLAAVTYEIVRKDFLNDKASRYYASATRMAGLTTLLLSTAPGANPVDVDLYLDQAAAISGPTSTQLDELRSISLYYELYRGLNAWRKASTGLARTASDIEELPSALLLEQAAMSLLKLPFPAKRRFALLMVLASLRFQKTGSKALARRCGTQALSIYSVDNSSAWSTARSYLEQILGRQAYNIGQARQALLHFVRLLNNDEGNGDEVTETGAGLLDDFRLAWDILGDKAEEIAQSAVLQLPTPVFDKTQTYITVASDDAPQTYVPPETWVELEQQFLKTGYPYTATSNLVYKSPGALLPDINIKKMAVGGMIRFHLTAHNPLDTSVSLEDLTLGFDFIESEAILLQTDAIPNVQLQPKQAAKITFSAKALAPGRAALKSVQYRFDGLLHCSENLVRQGRRLQQTKAHMLAAIYENDASLTVEISSPMPIVNVKTSTLPSRLYAGEVVASNIILNNVGPRDAYDLRVMCSHPSFVSLTSSADLLPTTQYSVASTLPNTLLPNSPSPLALADGKLSSNDETEVSLICRADEVGTHTIAWLFVFYQEHVLSPLVCQFSWTLEVIPSLELSPSLRRNGLFALPELTLEIFNDVPGEYIEIVDIVSLAPRWRFPLMEFQNGPIRLLPSQSVSVHTTVEPILETPSISDYWSPALRQLRLLLSGRELSSEAFPDLNIWQSNLFGISGQSHSNAVYLDCSKAPVLEQVLATRSRLRLAYLRDNFPSIDNDTLRIIFPLFDPHTADLIVHWRIPALKKEGYHYLTDLVLSAQENIVGELLDEASQSAGGRYEESQRERASLMNAIAISELAGKTCPVVVSQDGHFALTALKSPIAITKVYIRNLSDDSLRCSLSLLRSPLTEARRPPAVWLGKLLFERQLNPRQLWEVEAKYLPQDNIYDVGSWILTVQSTSQEWSINGQEIIKFETT